MEEAYEMPNESTPNDITVKLWNVKGKEESVKVDNPMIADRSWKTAEKVLRESFCPRTLYRAQPIPTRT